MAKDGYPTKFDVIDPRLQACAERKSDDSFGKCVVEHIEVQEQPSTELSPRFIGKGSGALVKKDINNNPIVGGTGLRRGAKKCIPSDKTKPLRECHVELDVPNEEDQTEFWLPNSPTLRFCAEKKQPGRLVSVTSPEEALATIRRFCDCQKVEGKEKCARKMSSKKG